MPAAHGAAAGSARTRRKRAHAEGHGEEGGSERWLVTYADMLTLLLVLFIVLFSVSVVNTSKFISLKTSLAAVFGDGKDPGIMTGGNGLNDNTADGTGQQMVMPGLPVAAKAAKQSDADAAAQLKAMQAASATATQKADFRAIRSSVTGALRKAGLAGSARFTTEARGLVITVVTDDLVFSGNSATLLDRGQKIIATIAPALRHESRRIEVDGYTNQAKVSTGPYPSGWELSSARASTVVRFLVGHGVPQSRLSAVGWSDQRPLYPASDPRAMALNRRVEIVIQSTR